MVASAAVASAVQSPTQKCARAGLPPPDYWNLFNAAVCCTSRRSNIYLVSRHSTTCRPCGSKRH
eukprot:355131-Chlamydomonas_euryale.AAC.2